MDTPDQVPVATPTRAMVEFWGKYRVAKSKHMSPPVTVDCKATPPETPKAVHVTNSVTTPPSAVVEPPVAVQPLNPVPPAPECNLVAAALTRANTVDLMQHIASPAPIPVASRTPPQASAQPPAASNACPAALLEALPTQEPLQSPASVASPPAAIAPPPAPMAALEAEKRRRAAKQRFHRSFKSN